MLDKVYIISLDHSPEYLENILERVNDLGLPENTPYFIINAFNGRTTELPSNYSTYSNWNLQDSNWDWWNRDITKGEIGCTLSHLICYQDIIDNGYKNVLILEDDFKVKGQLPVKELFDLNYEWDICVFGVNFNTKFFPECNSPQEVGLDNFIAPSYFYNSHCYFLSESGIQKIINYHIDNIAKNIIPMDELLSALCTVHPRNDIRSLFMNNMNALAYKTNIIGQYRAEHLGNSLTE